MFNRTDAKALIFNARGEMYFKEDKLSEIESCGFRTTNWDLREGRRGLTWQLDLIVKNGETWTVGGNVNGVQLIRKHYT